MQFTIFNAAGTLSAGVNANSELQVGLSATKALAGYARFAALGSDGTYNDVALTEDGTLEVSQPTLCFSDTIEGTAVNTNKWDNSGFTTMTITQAAGYISLNAGAITTINTNAAICSVDSFCVIPEFPLHVHFTIKTPNVPQTNMVMEVGIGCDINGNRVKNATAIHDGVIYRWNASAQFQAIIINAGVETPSAALTGVISNAAGDSVTMPPTINIAHVMEMEVYHDEAIFQINGVTVASVVAPAGIPAPVGNMRMFLICRSYIGATSPSLAPQISFGECVVLQKILATYEPWGETLCAMGQGIYQSASITFGQTATYANSAAPATRLLTNTTIADTGWGGLFAITPTFTANVDYLLFAPQVPIGFQLMLREVTIFFANLGAAQPATVLNLQAAIGLNASTASLATVDGAGTWAPRKQPLGQFRLAASAAIGDLPNPVEIEREMAYPWVVDSGRFLAIILRSKQTQTATASQVLDGGVLLNGYFR